MKSIALVVNPNNEQAQVDAHKIVKNFSDKNLKFINTNFNEGENSHSQHFDLVLVVGGDGTMIRACRCFGDSNVPIIGVNHGRLGFLTDLSDVSATALLADIFAGKFYARKRNMLKASINNKSHNHKNTQNTFSAINDVYLIKPKSISMLDINIYDNKEFLIAMRADGIIIATPTGSTAYTLSCGGPILHPQAGGFVLCAVAPHSLTNRPIVMPDNFHLTIKLPQLPKNAVANLFADGQEIAEVDENTVLEVCKSEKTFTLAHPLNYNFYQNLRNKLSWNEEKVRR